MATYLEIVQDFVREVGVGGGTGPSSVANQTGEMGRVVQFVRDAHRYICDLWPDWDFLWSEYQGNTTTTQAAAGSTVIVRASATGGGGSGGQLPSNIREYVTDSFQVQDGDSWVPVKYLRWQEFRPRFKVGKVAPASVKPTHWTVLPNRNIELSAPIGGVYSYRFNYYRRSTDLSENSSEIEREIPARLVLARAKIIYAERENAPEIMAGASIEYDDLLERLEANYCPGMAGGRSGENLSPDIS